MCNINLPPQLSSLCYYVQVLHDLNDSYFQGLQLSAYLGLSQRLLRLHQAHV